MPASLEGKHIFVVEDNKDNVFVILTLLRKFGARVQVDWWAKGEPHRLESAMPIDLIILDLMLSHGRTGFEVFDDIRRSPALDAAIALPKVRAQGFSGFISKPIDYQLFPQQIAAIIAGEQVWHAE